ncbi:putative 39S ribosomal protein L45, mitochondrial [Halotydeus destructor]|nr:putative 39S ribosomal protein L45, mitochondrial [Halotydeus destructor]
MASSLVTGGTLLLRTPSGVRGLSVSAVAAASPKHWPDGPPKYWTKHVPNYDWRWARARKVAKVPLPRFDDQRRQQLDTSSDSQITPDLLRSRLKEAGVVPQRPWNQRPVEMLCSMSLLDTYVPTEGPAAAGDQSNLLAKGKGLAQAASKKLVTKQRAIRRLRSFEPEFDLADFARGPASQLYLEAHRRWADSSATATDPSQLLELVTEHAFGHMMHNAHLKTVRWQHLGNLEEPLAVHAAVRGVGGEERNSNLFAQVTVRFHSQQLLAVYDRFGRLLYGSPSQLKRVLEFVVFEQYLSSRHGKWRMHAKLLPPWLPAKALPGATYRRPSVPAAEADKEDKDDQEEEDNEDEGGEGDKKRKRTGLLGRLFGGQAPRPRLLEQPSFQLPGPGRS